jgi:hypothetical protein
MTPAHLHAVTAFLSHIAQATGFPAGIDPDAKIQTMAVMLGEQHGDTRMFCDAAARSVAIDCGLMNMPSVGIISKLLEKWWARNKPATSFIQGPGMADLASADLSAEDRMNVQLWIEHDAAGDLGEAEMIRRLAIIRHSASKGYRWLLAQHTDAAMRAASLAVRMRWVDEEHTWAPPTQDDIDGVAATVRQRFATDQQREDMRADDGRVSIAPSPVAVGAAPAPIVMPDGRMAGALSADSLRAYREANLILREVQEREDAAKVVAAGRLPWWQEDNA